MRGRHLQDVADAGALQHSKGCALCAPVTDPQARPYPLQTHTSAFIVCNELTAGFAHTQPEQAPSARLAPHAQALCTAGGERTCMGAAGSF